MATATQLNELRKAYVAAKEAGHIFPEAVACEAAVETGWFTSKLYTAANNVFGEKQHSNPIYDSILMPTREFLKGQWVNVIATWVKFPTVEDSYKERMATLKRLATTYVNYASALAAKTPEEYLTSVSRRWSTDPARAKTCIGILHSHPEVFA